MKQSKQFLEVESTPSENDVKIVEMTIKDLGYDISLVDKAVADFKKTDSNFQRGSTMGKMLSNSIAGSRELSHERKSQLMQQISLFDFKKSPQPPQAAANTTPISQQPSTPRQDPPSTKRL